MEKLSEHHSALKCGLFVGGTEIRQDIDSFTTNGAQIVIGTPGRILDLHKRCPLFKFNKLEVLVLDEADTLLDMGFKDTINQIMSLLPKQRRTGLFSATQTKELKDLVRAGMRNPVSINVRVSYDKTGDTETQRKKLQLMAQQQATPVTLSNYFKVCNYDDRPGELIKFLQNHLENKIIVFCATCACVDYFSTVFNGLRKKDELIPTHFTVLGFHGKMIQKKRSLLYKKFVSATHGVMFSTDVAARGIDIPDVDWIVQLAAPKDPNFFVHRVGRTARAGRRGGALLFVTPEEQAYVNLLRGRGVPLVDYDGDSKSADAQVPHADDAMIGVDVQEDEEEEEEVDETGLGNVSDDEDEDDDNDAAEDDEHSHLGYDEVVELPDDEFIDPPATAHTEVTTETSSTKRKQDAFNARVLEEMKQFAIEDRAVLEAGSTAFMSFLRSYQEHLCSYIFKLDDLDIGAVARSYALLRLPKIPETRGLRGRKIQFETSPIDTSTIRYLHKEREKARKRKLEALKEKKEAEAIAAAAGDNNGADTQPTKREWIPPEEYQKPEEKRVRAKKRSQQQVLREEWEELAAEESAFKKFKKGKLSDKQYEKALFSDSSRKRNESLAADHDKSDDEEDDSDADVKDDSSDDSSKGSDDESIDSDVDDGEIDPKSKALVGKYLSNTNHDTTIAHKKSAPVLDENAKKLISFWTSKGTKTNVKPPAKKRPSIESDGHSLSAKPKPLFTYSSQPSTGSNTPSFFDKKRSKAAHVPNITDKLSSKNKQRVNEQMQRRHGKKNDRSSGVGGKEGGRPQQGGKGGGKPHGGHRK